MFKHTRTFIVTSAWVLVLGLFSASWARAQTVEYIHTDALGSPVAVTNGSGAVIERTVYEPYGGVVNRALTNGPGYTGHVTDAATSLIYMQQRYYDPSIGRFLSIDPVSAGDTMARYSYGNDNPYRFTDPSGLTTYDCSSNSATCPTEMRVSDLQSGDVIKTDGATVSIGNHGMVTVAFNHSTAANGRSEGYGNGRTAAKTGPIIIPVQPRRVDLKANMETAAKLTSVEFRDHVKNKGPWDFKQQGDRYQPWGNFHFGATGRANGFPALILLQEAGRAQTEAKTSDPLYGAPGVRLMPFTGRFAFGDDPVDQFWVQEGIRYHDEHR